MNGELASRLREAGLTEEQARLALGVFEDFLRERAISERGPGAGQEQFRGLFAGSSDLFEHRDA